MLIRAFAARSGPGLTRDGEVRPLDDHRISVLDEVLERSGSDAGEVVSDLPWIERG